MPPTAATLVRNSTYRFEASEACLDFQEQARDLGLVDWDSSVVQPCVLVVTRAADMEMSALSLAMAEQDIPVARLDADRCLHRPTTIQTDQPHLRLGGWSLRPLLLWRRHFNLTGIRVDHHGLHGAYAVDSWGAFVSWLDQRTDYGHVNDPTVCRGLDRMTQLQLARQVGLRVPRTIVTTQPMNALTELPSANGWIVKTLGDHFLEVDPGTYHGIFPTRLTRDTAVPDATEAGPVIVQEFLPARYEVRAYVVGDRLLSYRVAKSTAADLWEQPDSVAVAPCQLPSALSDALLAFARAGHLDIGAIDLLAVDGQYVFLEVNLSGDWRWFEQRAGTTDVSDAVRDWIAGRFLRLRDALPDRA